MFQSDAVKRYTIKYVLTVLVVGILLFVGVWYGVDRLDRTYLQEMAKLGENLSVLEKFGYTSYSMPHYNAAVKHSLFCLYLIIYGIYGVFAVLGYLLGLCLFHRSAKMMSRLADSTYNVLEGENIAPEFTGYEEGEIGIFISAYRKLLTALVQAKEQEQQERIFLQDLISDISHQLKTPLATLTIYQDLLSNSELDEAKKKEMLKSMGEQLSRMEWLVLNLLKLARLEAGSIAFEKKEQPLLPTLSLAVENVQMLAAEKKQTIRLACSEDISVNHDREWTVEALTNILKNATEYAPENSEISVRVNQTALTTTIHIRDNGIGIAPEDIHKIFKRFYRAKSGVNENSIGIGLSLAKGIMSGQNGDITVESEPEHYTEFRLVFYAGT